MQKLKVVSATAARANIFGLIDEAAEHHEPIIITSKRNNAVLIGEEDWRAIQETLYLSSIPGMRESILEAAGQPNEEFATEDEFMKALNGDE